MMKIIGKTIYFENAYGVKAYAKPQFILMNEEMYKCIDVVPGKVHLSFDALKDEYSHIGIPLSESPHVGLLYTIKNGGNIKETSYYKKEVKGQLDGRYELLDCQTLIDSHMLAYSNKKKGYPIIYKVGEVYYVLDGKHRLATAFIENQTIIKCIEIPSSVVRQDKYTCDILKMMQRKPEKYNRNIQHINSLI